MELVPLIIMQSTVISAYKLVLLIIMQSIVINHLPIQVCIFMYIFHLYILLSPLLSSPLKLIFFPSQTSLPTMSDSYSSYSNDSEELDPANIMEEYIAQQNLLGSIARQLIDTFNLGPSHRQSGPRRCIQRDHEGAHQHLVADYFAENPYPKRMFRTRFRMRKPLFLCIVNALSEWSPYFTLRADCANRQGLSPLQKCTSAIRMLAYGMPADGLDEYLKIGKSTALECLDKFAQGVIEVFSGEYMRAPTVEDVQRLL
jgi:hypothetical protein